ncbi:helix-turn-helix domain-containing protein, partial [Actinocatenispora thailandica]
MSEKSARVGSPPLVARVLELVAAGRATSRTELAALLGAAPSTISTAVGQLVDRGLIAEHGTQSSTGGRPRKVLRLGSTDEFAVA